MGAAKIKKANGKYPAQTEKVVPMKPTLPHYTNRSVVALMNSRDPRITDNDYGTRKCIVLSDVPGYFKYSDDRGGIATFYRGDTNQPVFTAAREITDEIRAAKCDNHGGDCTCDTTKWDELNYSCGCKEHHEGELYDVIPRIETCNTAECDGKHAHLMGMCDECFAIDSLASKTTKDIAADNINIQLR